MCSPVQVRTAERSGGNSARPAERWFLQLRPGDTPATSEVARITLEWIDTWLAQMQEAFGKVKPGDIHSSIV